MSFILGLLFVLMLPAVICAWSFTLEAPPRQCSSLNISWTGDFVHPLTFTILGLSGIGTNFTNFTSWSSGIVAEAIADSGDVTDNMLLGYNLPWGTPLVIVGSDVRGFGTGGTSDVYILEESPTFCPFGVTFNQNYLDQMLPLWVNPPQQCQFMTSIFSNVTLPVQTAVIVPGGESFIVSAPVNTTLNTSSSGGTWSGATQFWDLAVPQGTNISYYVSDATGPLFVSGLLTVQPGNDTCFTGETAHTSTTGPAAGQATGTPPVPSSGTSGNVRTSIMMGGVICGVVGLLIAVGVGM